MNGNGLTEEEKLMGSNPLSSWVRPVFAFMSGTVALVMAIFVIYAAVFVPNLNPVWPVALGILTVLFGFVAWYFGKRDQTKQVDSLASLSQQLINVVKEQLPKAKGSTVTATTGTATDNVAGPLDALNKEYDYGMPDKPQPIAVPFNEAGFDVVVDSAVMTDPDYSYEGSIYHKKWNAANSLAQDVTWRTNNNKAELDKSERVLDYAIAMFNSAWDLPINLGDPLAYVAAHKEQFGTCAMCKPEDLVNIEVADLPGLKEPMKVAYDNLMGAYSARDRVKKSYDFAPNATW